MFLHGALIHVKFMGFPFITFKSMTPKSLDISFHLGLGRFVRGEHLLIKYYNNDTLQSNNHLRFNFFYGLVWTLYGMHHSLFLAT
jgi:hypothetical protein